MLTSSSPANRKTSSLAAEGSIAPASIMSRAPKNSAARASRLAGGGDRIQARRANRHPREQGEGVVGRARRVGARALFRAGNRGEGGRDQPPGRRRRQDARGERDEGPRRHHGRGGEHD